MALLGNLFLKRHLLMYNSSAFALSFQPYFPNIHHTPQKPRRAQKCPGRAAQLEPSVSDGVKEADLLSQKPWQNSVLVLLR